jgi:CP family cyanate transporter-like MFS transporter
MKRYRILFTVAAAFLSAGSFWMFLPLIAVSLKAEGVTDLWVGLISGLPWLGLLAVSVFIPRIVKTLGLQRTILAGMSLSALSFTGFAATRSVQVWSLLCIVQGVSMGLRWAATDTWINGAMPDHARGRLVGLYELVLSGSLAAGPAFLAVTGTAGNKPFVAAAGIVAFAGFILVLGGREAKISTPHARRISSAEIWRLEHAAFISIGLVGLVEACDLSLLPLYGLSAGTGLHKAALLVVAVQIGGAAGAVICGVLADHISRRTIQLICGLAAVLLPLAIPTALAGWAIWPVLLGWGLAQGGLFTLGMVLLGTRFQGAFLAPAVALAMVVYTVGGIFGPPLLGLAMTAIGPAGLPFGLAAIAFFAFAVISLSAPKPAGLLNPN